MNVVTKSVDAAVNPIESDRPNGQAEVVLSTESLDRDGEHLWIDEWKQPLPARIHIDGDHGRSIEKTVGSCVPRIDGDRIVGTLDFAGTEYAQMTRQLVNEGHIRELSVTYAETKNQKDGKPQRELLNAAFVAIPANPEAVVLASKSAKVDATAKFKAAIEAVLKDAGFAASGNNPEVKHDQMVQAIHDAAYQLGSQCFNEIAADPGVDEGANKSVDGPTGKLVDGFITDIDMKNSTATVVFRESSSPKAGPPQESTEEPTAPTADKAADAAEESADDAGTKAKNAAIAARARAYLISRKPNQES